jgi:hypothetical protein
MYHAKPTGVPALISIYEKLAKDNPLLRQLNLSGNRNVVIIYYRLYNVAEIGGCIGVENYGRVAHNNKWKNRT